MAKIMENPVNSIKSLNQIKIIKSKINQSLLNCLRKIKIKDSRYKYSKIKVIKRMKQRSKIKIISRKKIKRMAKRVIRTKASRIMKPITRKTAKRRFKKMIPRKTKRMMVRICSLLKIIKIQRKTRPMTISRMRNKIRKIRLFVAKIMIADENRSSQATKYFKSQYKSLKLSFNLKYLFSVCVNYIIYIFLIVYSSLL